MENNTLLVMKGIDKQFPGVYALKSVDFDLRAGEVHALLGENGAGKSTLIKILGGIYTIDQGEIFVEGKQVAIHSVKDAQANGISIIHQELVLVPYMTVAENIFLGRESINAVRFVNKQDMIRKTEELLNAFGLDIKATAKVGSLTTANQQMVEIIKAISFNARIIVMDEPTSSLSEKEVSHLFETIKRLKSQGVGIIYISHRMSELMEITDRVTVMRDGEYIGTKMTSETTNDELIAMMVGRELTHYYTRTYNNPSETVLDVKNLNAGFLKDINFELKKGEILGFAGLVGAGRSEVMKCIFGIDPITLGEIWVNGRKVAIKNPNDAIGYGIGLIPENRKEEALFLQRSVKFNMTIKVLEQFIKGIFVNINKENEIAHKYVEGMSVKTPHLNQLAGHLSGGNQQKIVIGRWLATQPKILILDEPTRGVDVGAKAEIYAIMNELVKNGVSIIMISSELPEVINMSDRVVVMCNGRITGCLDRSGLSQEKIMHLATIQEDTLKSS
ncbi:sugar ABC transporter ATP-binding protein [Cellulosilyticum sp. I15G10I2]|uniref:sugar ABC transporter ATP-binding protein n=1 Tax=Cellulosilyticum sp. I15G10I2 TaxID=1892843 RepID=UPI00085BEF30|nr:sugar ABC transporter ATP-binding protein [Cellulosilyticum sp. I15G10I2]